MSCWRVSPSEGFVFRSLLESALRLGAVFAVALQYPLCWGMCRLHCNCREEVGEYSIGEERPVGREHQYSALGIRRVPHPKLASFVSLGWGLSTNDVEAKRVFNLKTGVSSAY